MIDICFLCCNERQLTSEHIVPQCLGGVLKADIYCSVCNSTCGQQIDVELSRLFGRYATLLRVKRERGDNQPFTFLSETDGIRLECDGVGLKRASPSVQIDKDGAGKITGIDVRGRSPEEARTIVHGLVRKHGLAVEKNLL